MALLLLGACGFSARAAPDASTFHDAQETARSTAPTRGYSRRADRRRAVHARVLARHALQDRRRHADHDHRRADLERLGVALDLRARRHRDRALRDPFVPQRADLGRSSDGRGHAEPRADAEDNYYGFTYAPAGRCSRRPCGPRAPTVWASPTATPRTCSRSNVATGATTHRRARSAAASRVAGDLAWVQG